MKDESCIYSMRYALCAMQISTDYWLLTAGYWNFRFVPCFFLRPKTNDGLKWNYRIYFPQLSRQDSTRVILGKPGRERNSHGNSKKSKG